MYRYLKEGWKAALQQPFLLLVLFAYRLAWGVVLYSIVKSIIVPLLHRYPGTQVSGGQTQLFLAEGQFRLLKTDIMDSYLWLMLGLLLARMIVTPLLNAGIYYSLQQTQLNSGYRFFKGIRELGSSFMLYYLLQMILTLAPLYVLLPQWSQLLFTGSYKSAIMTLLPYAAGFLMYGYILHLLFMYLQFGRASERGWTESIGVVIHSILPIAGISLLFLLGTFLFTTFAASAVWIWASFWAILLYQAYRLIQTFFELWVITAQRQLYSTKIKL
jgi:hypothetical protein